MKIRTTNSNNCELKFFITEILFIALFILCFASLDYFVIWQPSLSTLLQYKQNYRALKSNLAKKQALLEKEKKTNAALKQWQNKDPVFYHAVSSITTTNNQISLLTERIQNTHFQILQMTKNNPLKNTKTDCQLLIESRGQWTDLLSLLTVLTHWVIPFQLSQLAIHQHQYKMTFILRDCHE